MGKMTNPVVEASRLKDSYPSVSDGDLAKMAIEKSKSGSLFSGFKLNLGGVTVS